MTFPTKSSTDQNPIKKTIIQTFKWAAVRSPLKQKLCLCLDLEAGTLDLSLQPWTFLLKTCCQSWNGPFPKIDCQSKNGPSSDSGCQAKGELCSKGRPEINCHSQGEPFPEIDCQLQEWTISSNGSSIGLVIWKLGLRPSFFLNETSFSSLDLNDGALDLWVRGPLLNCVGYETILGFDVRTWCNSLAIACMNRG